MSGMTRSNYPVDVNDRVGLVDVRSMWKMMNRKLTAEDDGLIISFRFEIDLLLRLGRLRCACVRVCGCAGFAG